MGLSETGERILYFLSILAADCATCQYQKSGERSRFVIQPRKGFSFRHVDEVPIRLLTPHDWRY